MRLCRLAAPLLLAATMASSCGDSSDQLAAATAQQVARFKYCTGFTSAAEHAAYRGLTDRALAESLRTQQIKAGNRLALPPLELEMGQMIMKADENGQVSATTTTEIGRGLEDGYVMIDGNQREKLSAMIHECRMLFEAIVAGNEG